MKAWKTIRRKGLLVVCALAVLLAATLALPLALPRPALAQNAEEEIYERDGSKIEGIDLFWLTPDSTVDNNGDPVPETELNDNGAARRNHLYIATDSDARLSMTFQCEISLSGQYDYAPGEIKITLPAQVWHGRDSSGDAGQTDPDTLLGGMDIPVPQAPSTEGDFCWMRSGNTYVLTNTRTIGATSKALFTMSVNDLLPSDLVDMSQSDPITVHVDVITNQGNLISRTSDPITAQVDTCARLTEVKKDSKNELYETAPAHLPAQLLAGLPDAPENYVYVRWYSYVYHKGNQPFSLTVEDTPLPAYEDTDAGEVEVTPGIYLGCTDTEGNVVTDSTVVRNAYHDATTASQDHMLYFWTAYRKDRFRTPTAEEDPVTYLLYNSIAWELTEYDRSLSDTGYGKNPDGRDSSAKDCIAQIAYSPVRWERPTGRMEVFKYTERIDEKDWTYGDGLNSLIAGEDVDMQFAIRSVGFGYPWTSHRTNPDDPLYVGEDEVAPEDFGVLGWKQTINDCDTFFDNNTTPLTAEDYEVTSFRVQDPILLSYRRSQGNEWGYTPNGVALEAEGIKAEAVSAGHYAYFPDSTLPKPDVTIEFQRNGDGVWLPAATGTWSNGGYGAFTYTDLQNGVTAAGRTLYFPENTTDVRHSYTSNVFGGVCAEKCDIAAINWDMGLGIKLKASEANIAVAEKWFSLTDTPSAKFRNDVRMEVFGWVDAAADGTPNGGVLLEPDDKSFYDYSRATLTGVSYGASLVKEVEFNSASTENGGDNDIIGRRAILHYSAKVVEASNLTERSEYDKAVASGAIPAETGGIWYDLLPEGVVPLLNTVKLRPGDTVVSKYIIDNYKNSGRTLLVVECDLTPAPYVSDGSVYADSPSITFDAVYPWSEIGNHTGTRAINYIAFESTSDGLRYNTLGTITGQRGEGDDPRCGNNTLTPDMPDKIAEALTDLDPNTDENRFLYAKCDILLDMNIAAVTELSKLVRNDLNGIWTQGLRGQEQVTVFEGQTYTYQLKVANSPSTTTTDIVIYDALENYDIPDPNGTSLDATKVLDYNDRERKKVWEGDWQGKGQWRGTLESVDLSQYVAAGVAPVLYYSTTENLTFKDSSYSSTQDGRLELFSKDEYDLSNTAFWTRAEPDENGIWAVPDALRGKVTGIALDARKTADGSSFVLEPGKSLCGYLHMRAPDDNSDPDSWAAKGAYAHRYNGREYIKEVDWQLAISETNNMYAFNNTRLKCVQSEEGSSDASSSMMIRNDYTRVGILPKIILVSKTWNDENNRDGLRPDSVTIRLIRKVPGEAFREVTDEDGNPVEAVLHSGNNWSAVFEQIDVVNEQGISYIYSFKEDPVPGYTAAVIQQDENIYRIVNTHESEKITIEGEKQWDDCDNAYGTRPSHITLGLYINDYPDPYTLTNVYPDENGKWFYSFTDLDKYDYGGREYVYTVKEEPVPMYAATITDNSLVVNKYTPFTDLTVLKVLKDASPAAAQVPFTFTIRLLEAQTAADAAAGKEPLPLTDTYRCETFRLAEDNSWVSVATDTIGCSGSFVLRGDEKLVIYDLPSGSTYGIEEAPADGFSLYEAHNPTGTLAPGMDNMAVFVNEYSAQKSLQIYGTKTQTGHALAANQHSFRIIDATENSPTKGQTVGTAYSGMPVNAQDPATGEITATAPIQFSDLNFTQADAGKTFYYQICEENIGVGGYTYDPTVYTIRVEVEDMGDGTLSITAVDDATGLDVTQPGGQSLTFANSYQSRIDLAPKAWKSLLGGELSEGDFSFELYSYDSAAGTVLEKIETVANNADGEVLFTPITFTQNDLVMNQPLTKTYLIQEVIGDDPQIIWSKQAFIYTVTLQDNDDGVIAVEETITAASRACADCSGEGADENGTCALCGGTGLGTGLTVTGEETRPVFYNRLPDGQLTVTKQVSTVPNPDPEKAFRFVVQMINDVPVDPEYIVPDRDEADTPGSGSGSDGSDAPADPDDPGSGSSVPKYYMPADTAGEPFAVLDKTAKTLTFFRSEKSAAGVYEYKGFSMPETLFDMNSDKLTDTAGNREFYRLTKYETTDYGTDSVYWPWNWYYDTPCTEVRMEGPFKPTSCSRMFHNGQTLTKIDLSLLDTSECTSMANMFNYCNRIESYDLRHLDTSMCRDMNRMFYYNSALTELKQDFDTSKVESMEYMFYYDTNLSALNFSNLETGNVKNFGSMFQNCTALKTIDVSHFDTSSATNMDRMFYYCTALNELDVSGFNTSNVTSMYDMFSNCSTLKVLDVSGFDTAKVTSMSSMFSDCSSLAELDVSGFDTANATNMSSMFSGCSSLAELDVSGFNTAKVTSMSRMFSGTHVALLDLSNFSLDKITSASGLTNMLYEADAAVQPGRTLILGDSFVGRGYTTTIVKNKSFPFSTLVLPAGTNVFSANTTASIPSGSAFTGKWVNTANGSTLTSTDSLLKSTQGGTWEWQLAGYEISFAPGEGGTGYTPKIYSPISEAVSATHNFYNFGMRVSHFTDGRGNSYPLDREGFITIPAYTYAQGDKITLTAHWVEDEYEVVQEENRFYFELRAGESLTFTKLPAGTRYSVWEETAEGWTLVSRTNASGIIEPAREIESVFTNKTAPDRTNAFLYADKLMDYQPAQPGAFSFTLSHNGTVLQTKTNDETGVVAFDPIEYTANMVGNTYTYTIQEVQGADSSIRYDSRVFYANVAVKSGDDGIYTEVSYTDSYYNRLDSERPLFLNGTTGELALTKRNTGVPTTGLGRSFTLKVLFTAPDGTPWDNPHQLYLYGSNGNSYYPSYGEVLVSITPGETVTLSGIPAGLHYTVQEETPYDGAPGWTLDPNVYSGVIASGETEVQTVENKYAPTPTTYSIMARKYAYGYSLQGGDHTFELLSAITDEYGSTRPGTVIATATNDSNGNILFDGITFDRDGTFTYYIREVPPDDPAIDYPESPYKITVTVSNNRGTLKAQQSATPSFRNSLEENSSPLGFMKELDSPVPEHAQKDFTFTITLTNPDGTPYEDPYFYIAYDAPIYDYQPLTLVNGTATFTTKPNILTYTSLLPGGTHYSIAEVPVAGFVQTGTDTSGTIPDEYYAYAYATIKNTYAPTGSLALNATKQLTGATLREGQFSFRVYDEANGSLLATATNAADGSILIDVPFTADDIGQKTLLLVEEAGDEPGITYDSTQYRIPVMIADNGDGTLSVTIDERPADGYVFANTYSDKTAITATKEWEGDGEHPETRCDIKLTLYGQILPEARYVVGEKIIPADAEGDDLTVIWDDLPAFREADGVKEDILYTVEEEMLTGDGAVLYVGGVLGDEEQGFRIVNRYMGVAVELTASKELTGRTMTEDDRFTFHVYDGDRKVAQAANEGSSISIPLYIGWSDLADAPRDENGNRTKTFEYQITEADDGQPGITYDNASYTATVTVVQDATGSMSAAVVYDTGDRVFTNTYTAEGSVQFGGTKTLEGRALAAEQFSFTLTGEGVDETVTNAMGGSFAFSPIEYTLADLGEHVYTVTEVDGGASGYTYDDAVYTIKVIVTDKGDGTLEAACTINGAADTPIVFENTYAPGGSVQFSGTKTLEGRALAAEQFSFTLTGEGITETVTNTAGGSFAFSPIEYTLADVGEHEYTVTEVNGGLHGYTYDSTVYTISVTVTDNGAGDLIAAYTVNGEADAPIAFTNAYVPDGSVQFGGTKKLNGRTLEAEQFSFTLTGEGITETVTNAADGSFTFFPIEYTLADVGEHEYTVTEVNGGAHGYTYDSTVYTINVTVTDNGAGDLLATYTVNGAEDTAIAFENTYDADCTLAFAGAKTVGGKEPEADQVFTFQLKAEDGTVLQQVENDKGSIRFAPISYTLADVGKTHRYTIVESSESTEQYRSDTSLYTLTVTLTDPGTGKLEADWTLTRDGEEAANILFDNTPLTQLEISKTVVGRETDRAFSFLVTLTDADGNPLEGTFPVTGIGTAAIESGDTLLLKHGETARIAGLPVGSGYTVEETAYTAYDTAVNGVNGSKAEGTLPAEGATAAFTNTGKTTSFSVTKRWEGGSGPITLTIYADGEQMVPQPVVQSNGVEYTCTDLPMYTDEGVAIVYSAKEQYVDGYVTIYQNVEPHTHNTSAIFDGGTIINRAVTSIRVRKVWEGLAEGEKAPKITLTLYCNGEKLNKKTPEPDANGWYVFKNLPIRYNGADAEYLVKEEPLPGFAVSYGEAAEGQEAPAYALNGGTIVNRKLPQTGDSAMPGLWLAMILLSGAAAVWLLKRRYSSR